MVIVDSSRIYDEAEEVSGEMEVVAGMIQHDLFSVFLSGLEEVRELPVDFSEKLFHRLVDYATVYFDAGWYLPSVTGRSQHRVLK